MKRISPNLWKPADQINLEPSAVNVVKTSANSLVIAGPGAGKTELLAQKACFLLQTNTCKYPHRILAISFKKDAAHNLKERVRLRCGEELSRRFDSLTFDAFAKQILDRFKQSLSQAYKINGKYEIIFNERSEILEKYKIEDNHYFNTTNHDTIINSFYPQLPLPGNTKEEQLRQSIWKSMLKNTPSIMSFKMMMRLAEYIISTNPIIKQYLQQTYHYIFLDEFQDTTAIQYDFLKSCFFGSKCFFTAVGDDKQRIMGWAGAKADIFNHFTKDTNATPIPLTMNFRCAPRLIELLNYLTRNLLGKTDFAVASDKWEAHQGDCSILKFDNPQDEMNELYKKVNNWIAVDNLNPRDVCILVKQQLSIYAGELIDHFNANGLRARDESIYQDILNDEVSLFIINTLYHIFGSVRCFDKKQSTFNFLKNLYSELDDQQLIKLDSKFSKCIKEMQNNYIPLLKGESIKEIISKIVALAGEERIIANYLDYKNISELNTFINDLQEKLIKQFSLSGNIISALDMLMGKDTIPVMTIHKSKGLEYHTVIFMGLEDNAFWSYEQHPDEDKCAFFVALSRAKERVVFTFSKERKNKWGRTIPQSNEKIYIFFDKLRKSGIVNV